MAGFHKIKYEDMSSKIKNECVNEAQPAIAQPHVIRRRHKWKRVGHTFDHTWQCEKCGCIKDAVRLFSTEYRLNGETTETAPNCPATFL